MEKPYPGGERINEQDARHQLKITGNPSTPKFFGANDNKNETKGKGSRKHEGKASRKNLTASPPGGHPIENTF